MPQATRRYCLDGGPGDHHTIEVDGFGRIDGAENVRPSGRRLTAADVGFLTSVLRMGGTFQWHQYKIEETTAG